MTAPLVRIEQLAPQVGLLRLCRPAKRNALNQALVGDALAALDTLEDQGVDVAVLAAEGPVFCGGADLTEDLGIAPGGPSAAGLVDAVLSSRIFWIAAVPGPALGIGVSLAAACPLTVVDGDAWFSLPEMRFGVFATGAIAYLEPRLGQQFCLEWALLNRRYPATAPELRPLVSVLAGPGTAEDEAVGIARSLAAAPAASHAARLAFQGGYLEARFTQRRDELAHLLNQQLSRQASLEVKE